MDLYHVTHLSVLLTVGLLKEWDRRCLLICDPFYCFLPFRESTKPTCTWRHQNGFGCGIFKTRPHALLRLETHSETEHFIMSLDSCFRIGGGCACSWWMWRKMKTILVWTFRWTFSHCPKMSHSRVGYFPAACFKNYCNPSETLLNLRFSGISSKQVLPSVNPQNRIAGFYCSRVLQ